MRKSGSNRRGATMLENMMVFAFGFTFILSGALVGSYTLHSYGIMSQQQFEATAFKTIVETAQARSGFPEWRTVADMKAYLSMVPEARLNPFTHQPRQWNRDGGEGAYFAARVPSAIINAHNNNPLGNNLQGGFAFLWNDSPAVKNDIYTVNEGRGKSTQYLGWIFYETDMSGNITAVVGGYPIEKKHLLETE